MYRYMHIYIFIYNEIYLGVYIDIDNDQVEIVAKPIDLTFDGPAHLMN